MNWILLFADRVRAQMAQRDKSVTQAVQVDLAGTSAEMLLKLREAAADLTQRIDLELRWRYAVERGRRAEGRA